MKREILWDPAAWADIDEAFDRYALTSRATAEGFRTELMATVKRIAADPKAHPMFEREARCCLLQGYPFGLIYTLNDEYIVMVVAMQTRAIN